MLISIHSKKYESSPRLMHVLSFLSNHPFCPKGHQFSLNEDIADMHIDYHGELNPIKEYYSVKSQNLFFTDKEVHTKNLLINSFQYEDNSVYGVQDHENMNGKFFDGSRFGFDVFETIFFLISRYEEQFCDPTYKDQWDMMFESRQLLVRSKLQEIPIVDHLVKSFFLAIGLPVKSRMTQKTMTHDIDVLEKYGTPIRTLRAVGRAILDHGFKGLQAIFKTIRNRKSNPTKDPYYTFDFLLIDQTIKNISNKIIFFMAGGETKHDNYYHINSSLAIEIIEKAKEKGYEIGLHPSYNTWQKADLFHLEKKLLEEVSGSSIRTSRQHFLHFSFCDTIQILEENHIKFDSSLGYQRLIGFRCGTGFPFYLYNFETEQTSTVQELPMVIMDGALLDQNHHNLDQAIEHLSSFLLKNQFDTHLTFNFHNTIFDPTKRDVNKMKLIYKLACACS